MSFRARRLRKSPSIRALSKENILTVNDLIYPLFVKPGKGVKEEISSMPGQYRISLDMLKTEMEELVELGIKAVLLFGLAKEKNEQCSEAMDDNGVVQQAIKYIKELSEYMRDDGCVCLCSHASWSLWCY